MNHTVQYKGYTASIEHSDEDACYVGRVMGMNRHRMAFHGDTIEETHSVFIETIDFYLDTCAEEGTEPERPSAIIVLLPTNLYLEVSEKAERKGLTVPKLIAEAVQTV